MEASQEEVYLAIHQLYPATPKNSVVLLGSAINGPVGVPVTINSYSDALKLYGNTIVDKKDISYGSTDLSLSYSPRDTISISGIENNKIVSDSIPGIVNTNSSVSFLPFGRGQNSFVFSYTPLKNEYYLLDNIKFTEQFNSFPLSVVRINGSHASTVINCGEEEQLVLVATDGGENANNITAKLYYTGVRKRYILEISGIFSWDDRRLIIDITDYNNLKSLVYTINQYALANKCSVAAYCESGDSLPSLLGSDDTPDENGILEYTFSGGTQGVAEDFTPTKSYWYDQILSTIQQIDFSKCHVVHITLPPVTGTESLSTIDDIFDYISSSVTDDIDIPPLFVFSCVDGTDTVSLENLVLHVKDSYGDIAHLFSFVLGSINTPISTIPLGLYQTIMFNEYLGNRALTGSILPDGSTLNTELSRVIRRELASIGIQTAFTRRNVVALEHDYSLASNSSIFKSLFVLRTLQVIIQRISDVFSNSLGKNFSDIPPIDETVSSILLNTESIKEADFSYNIFPSLNEIDISIDAVLFNEISLFVTVRCINATRA